MTRDEALAAVLPRVSDADLIGWAEGRAALVRVIRSEIIYGPDEAFRPAPKVIVERADSNLMHRLDK